MSYYCTWLWFDNL